MVDDRDIKIKTAAVPMHDTGLGREAGFKDDAEMVAAINRELEALLTPEGLALIRAAEADAERQFLLGF